LNHIKASIWDQTLTDVLKEFPKSTYKLNHGDLVVRFFNGSEIYLTGFDDKERIEKNLGREFCMIYFNECSTINYNAVLLSQSSLAQNIPGLKNKVLYDMNPPPPTHWTYKLFIEKLEPKTGEPLKHPDNYKYLLMNPMDNPYLSEDFLETLDALPDRERRRYKFGEFVKPEGAIYDEFNIETHSIPISQLPQMEDFAVGIDNTGNNLAAILIGFAGSNVYILDEYTAYRQSMSEFNATIYYKWAQYSYIAYPDPAAGPLNDLITNASKTDNAVEPGINYIRELIEDKRLFVVLKSDGTVRCPDLIAEIDSYRYDDKGRIIKEDDHLCDSLRYCIYSHAKYGGSIIQRLEA